MSPTSLRLKQLHPTIQGNLFAIARSCPLSDLHPSVRQVSQPLVDAYLARRALDYLVGFNLSPVLWRKLPGARSAGGWWGLRGGSRVGRMEYEPQQGIP